MSGQPPKLSPEQLRIAREKALESRRIRAEVKRKFSEGILSFEEILADSRDSIRRLKVVDLLSALPGYGTNRASTLMQRCGISASRRIGGLGLHQQAALFRALQSKPRSEGEVMESMSHSTKFFQEGNRSAIGKLMVISGPGGVGKSTVTKALRDLNQFWVSISATTRPPRITEVDGEDYFFLSDREFDALVERDELLEWATFAGARYGTPRSPVELARNEGKCVVLEIEIEGARQVKEKVGDALSIFLKPPSWEVLEARLTSRGTDTPERRAARLALAQAELAAADEFDLVIINDRVEEVVNRLVSLAFGSV